jgi:hypothetical protein
MFYFELYGNLGFWIATLLGVGLLLLTAGIYYSVRAYKKPVNEDGTIDEHAEPGIPLVLKGLYLGLAIYIIAATVIVAKSGMAI